MGVDVFLVGEVPLYCNATTDVSTISQLSFPHSAPAPSSKRQLFQNRPRLNPLKKHPLINIRTMLSKKQTVVKFRLFY